MSKRIDGPTDWRKRTPEEQEAIIAEARRMLGAGRTLSYAATALNCQRDTLRRRLDPAFGVADRERAKGYRAADAKAMKYLRASQGPQPWAVDQAETAARLAAIPADTRSLTGQIFGDPLPERSALGRLP